MAKPTLTTSAAFRTMEQNLPVMVTSRSIWEMSVGRNGPHENAHEPIRHLCNGRWLRRQ